MEDIKKISFEPIGVIKTPYISSAPYQPIDSDENEFIVEVNEEYIDGLKNLEEFKFIYLVFFLDKTNNKVEMKIKPPWTKENEVGLFASRSPNRPNPIGLSVVRLKKIVGNKIYTSGLDVFNDTPLLDIKPYIKELDSKFDAGYGWINISKDEGHLALHIKGVPHFH